MIGSFDGNIGVIKLHFHGGKKEEDLGFLSIL